MLTNTNLILKKVIMNASSYYKQSLIRLLAVDVENSNPVLFNGMKYKKSVNEKDLFLFLNKDFKILGILKGNKHDKIFFDYESGSRYSDDIPRNRKHLTEKAEYILMLPTHMRIYRPKQIQKTRRNENKDKLRKRLQDYKIKKHNSINHNTIMEMSKLISSTIIDGLLNNDINVQEKLRKLDTFHCDLGDGLRRFGSILQDYMRSYESMNKNKNNTWMYTDSIKTYEANKVEIIKWFKLLAI